MGSITGSVGSKSGMRITLASAPQTIILTSLYLAEYPVVAATTIQYVGFEFGWRTATFQLVPGSATGLSVAILVTLDQDSATSESSPGYWEEIPMPAAATGEWSNPLAQGAGTQLARIDSGPWTAIALQVSATTLTAASNAALYVAAAA